MYPAAKLSILRSYDEYLFHFECQAKSNILENLNLYPVLSLFGSTSFDSNLRIQLNRVMKEAIEAMHTLYASDDTPDRLLNTSANNSLQRLGQFMFNNLLPLSVREQIQCLSDETSLFLVTNDPELPWELLHDNKEYLALKHPLGRQLLSSILPSIDSSRRSTNHSFLFITDPRGDLPEAQQEVEQLVSLFDPIPNISTKILGVKRATKFDVLQELMSGQYSVIHYSGHIRSGALLLFDGELTSQEIPKALLGNPFVFLNGCQSAEKSNTWVDNINQATSLGFNTQNLISAFIRGGASGCLGTLWRIFDASSREFALQFYTSSLNGNSVGEALRQTRIYLREARPNDPLWASYVLYSDPALRIINLERREPKLVTVLTARISGLSDIFCSLPIELADEIENKLIKEVYQIVGHYEGEILGIPSNILTICFGISQAHRDDAKQAICTALDLINVIHTFNQQQQKYLLQPINVQIGISTGQVIIRKIQTLHGIDYHISGNVTNLSAQLARQSVGEQIVVDEITYRQARDSFIFELVSNPKNTDSSIESEQTYLVLKKYEFPVSAKASVQIIGRDAELVQLQSLFRQVVLGQGRIVRLTGIAGVGKTRLVQAFRESLGSESYHWITGTCYSYNQDKPNALLAQIIYGLAGITSEDDEAIARTKLIEMILKLDFSTINQLVREEYVNELLALIGQFIGFEFFAPGVNNLESKLRWKRMTKALQIVFAGYTKHKPLVLSIEDMQWIDETSLIALEALMNIIAQTRILLVAMCRPDWSYQWKQNAYYQHLSLNELNIDSCYKLLSALLGHKTVPPKIADIIINQTAGNPLFIEEVVKSLQERGALVLIDNELTLKTDLSQFSLPYGVQKIIEERIDQLTELNRKVLEKASVIGQKFDEQILEQIQTGIERHTLDENLDELNQRNFIRPLLLDELNQRDFILADLSSTLIYIFSHALVHQTIYEKIPDRTRRTFHRLVAEVIRRLSHNKKDENSLAYHYYLSDDRVNAVIYCLRAAQQAADTWSNATALTWYDRALEKLKSFEEVLLTETEQKLGTTSQQISHWSVAVLEGKADVQWTIGLNNNAIGNYMQALTILSVSGDISYVHQADLHRKMAIAHHDKGELAAAWDLLNTALSLLGETVSIEAGRIYNWLGLLQFRRGKLEDSLAFCLQGIQVNEYLKNIRDLAQAHNLQGMIYLNLGRSEEAIRAHQNSIDAYKEDNYKPGLERANSNLGVVYESLSQWDAALRCYQESKELSEDTGEERRKAAALLHLGEIYRLQGKLDQAIEMAQQAQSIGQTLGFQEVVGLAQMNLGACHLKKSEFTLAKKNLEESRKIFELIETYVHLPEITRHLAELYIRAGDLDKSRSFAEKAVQSALELDQMQLGQAYRVLAQTYQQLSQFERANTELNKSLTILQGQKCPYEEGLTLEALAVLHEIQAKTNSSNTVVSQQAIVYCHKAMDIFREIGAQFDLEQAEQILRRLE